MPLNRRDNFSRGLHPLYLPFYLGMCKMLGPHWQPTSGLRSFSYQESLYAQGRSSPGKIVTNARAGESAHNYGCASDWTLWTPNEKPIWDLKDPRWDEYFKVIEKLGLKAGKLWGDSPHNELKLACSWKQVLVAYNADISEEFIRGQMQSMA